MLQNYRQGRQIRKSPAHAIEETKSLPCEYAKYKNRCYVFAVTHDVLIVSSDSRRQTMPDRNDHADAGTAAAPSPPKELTPAARRALAEAEARRQQAAAEAKPRQKEFQGPKGPEPTRYGDWENKGIASDF
jgi:hypothetical protein